MNLFLYSGILSIGLMMVYLSKKEIPMYGKKESNRKYYLKNRERGKHRVYNENGSFSMA